MADEQNQNMSMDQIEFMKRMKAIASDLWGGRYTEDETEEPEPEKRREPQQGSPQKPAVKSVLNIHNLWKTADETIDWTDALAHGTPSDGLTGQRMWSFYHKYAEQILSGDLDAYTEILQKSNPLGELTDFAEKISMRAPDPDRLESTFTSKAELLEKDRKQYLSALGLRIARDLLACLPVSEVVVKGEHEGETVYSVTFTRQQLMHRNFAFIDPVALSEECGAQF